MIGQSGVIDDVQAPSSELSVLLRGSSMRVLEVALAVLAIVTAAFLDHLRLAALRRRGPAPSRDAAGVIVPGKRYGDAEGAGGGGGEPLGSGPCPCPWPWPWPGLSGFGASHRPISGPPQLEVPAQRAVREP